MCILIGIIDLTFNFTNFWEDMLKLKLLELYLIFIYFLFAALLRPRAAWIIPIARCFMFFLVCLQVTMIISWFWNQLFPIKDELTKEIFLKGFAEFIPFYLIFSALMVDFFWNRMIFQTKDALWGWSLVLLAHFIEACVNRSYGE